MAEIFLALSFFAQPGACCRGLLLMVFSIVGAVFWTAFMLYLVVFSHEVGHYLVASALNEKIERFAVGVGPKLTQGRSKSGVIYSVGALPLMGYVEMGDSFEESRLWEKVFVLIGGAVGNVVLATVCVAIFEVTSPAGTEAGPLLKEALGSMSGGYSGIVELTVASIQVGVFSLVIAGISVLVGIMNLIPIPTLDGGRIAIAVFESTVLGRPVSERAKRILNGIGMGFISYLLLIGLSDDIVRIGYWLGG